MNLEFIELELDWPIDLSVCDLRKYILSNLIKHGEPLRWAITSLSDHSYDIESTQKISIEAILIINEEKTKDINAYLN